MKMDVSTWHADRCLSSVCSRRRPFRCTVAHVSQHLLCRSAMKSTRDEKCEDAVESSGDGSHLEHAWHVLDRKPSVHACQMRDLRLEERIFFVFCWDDNISSKAGLRILFVRNKPLQQCFNKFFSVILKKIELQMDSIRTMLKRCWETYFLCL